MQRSSFIFVALLSFGALLPAACTQNFNIFEPSGGTGGSSSSSSSHSSSSGTGGVGGCMADADCDDVNSCTTDTCNKATGKCKNTNLPDGPVPGFVDMMKDCQTNKCVGGKQMSVADDLDLPDDGDPCTTDTCMAGAPQHDNAPMGTTCGMTMGGVTLICDGMDHCVGCVVDNDCNDPGICKTRTCDGMQVCQFGNVAAHQACPTGVCDGNGNCIGCVDDTDCGAVQNGVCENSACINQCNDGQKNGGESDIDCGGNTCDKCPNDDDCNSGGDCQSGFCNGGGKCKAPTCNDGVRNGVETDTDCGGATCDAMNKRCVDGKMCLMDGDCVNSNCFNNAMCVSCVDGVQDGNETDKDCGGADCDGAGKTCVDGKKCAMDVDCAGGHCYHNGGGAGQKTCHSDLCNDGAADGGEGDIDCGGPCAKCADGKKCGADNDCSGGHCYHNGGGAGQKTCHGDLCNDGAADGGEGDVDCGGPCATKCALGKACGANADCMSVFCVGMKCVDSCHNLVKDGNETDVDCGGATCDGEAQTCAYGKTCAANADCASGLCDVAGGKTCQCQANGDCPMGMTCNAGTHACN